MAFGDSYLDERAKELGLFQEEKGEPFSVGGTLGALGSGFLSGFTGFKIGDDPDNAIEGIAHSLGSVAGFLGFIPNVPGLAGRVAASSLIRATGIGGRFAKGASTAARGPAFINIGSVPLKFADKVIDVAKASPKLKAAVSANSLLSKPIVRDRIVEGARFGLASGFSATAHGEDFRGILKATGFGVADGAVFHWFNTKIRQDWLKGLQGPKKEQYEMAARGLTNALWSGVPSTFAGAPLESQVFEYALGLMFGVHDAPYEVRKANEFMRRKNAVDLTYIEKVPGFDNLEDVVKSEVLRQRDLHIGKHINTSGDGEAQGVISKAITGIFNEQQEKSYQERIARGEDEQTAFEGSYNDAVSNTGARSFKIQQQRNWTSLGPIFRSNHFKENRPELWIGDNPDSPGKAVSYNKDRNRIIIDDELLEKNFQDSEIESKAEYLSREVLTEYLGKTTGDGVDVQKLVNDEVDAFGLGKKAEDTEATPEAAPQQDTPFKGHPKTPEIPELAKDVEPVESVRRNSLTGVDYTNNKSAVEQAREDHDLPSLIANPLENIVESVSKISPGIDSGELRQNVFSTFAEKDITWDKAVEKVESYVTSKLSDPALEESGARLNLGDTKEFKRDLRRAWKLYKSNQGIRQGHYSGGQFHLYGDKGLGRVDGSGRAIAKAKTKTHLQKSLEDKVSTFVIEKTEVREGGRAQVKNIFDDADNEDFDTIRYLEDSYRNGTPFFMGTKDKGRAQHTEGFLFDKTDQDRLFNDKLAAVARVEAEHGVKGLGITDAMDQMRKEAIAQGMSKEAYEGLMLNNMLILENMNGGIKFEDMLRMNKTGEGHFITAPHKLNKRGSLFDVGGVPADPAMYNKRVQEQGGFRAIVVNGKYFDGHGVKPIELPGIGRAEHHQDGVVYMEQDSFDRMLSDVGGDDGSGVIKGSSVFATEGEGMFLGKMAISRAPDGMQGEMARLGVDQIYMDSATKQRGKREEYYAYRKKDGRLQITRNQGRNGAPIKNLNSFIIPFDGMRLNMSVGEKVDKALSDQRAPSQLHANLADEAARDHFIKEHIEPSVRGDEGNNTLYRSLKDSYDDSSIDKLEWDGVSLTDIAALYSGIKADGTLEDVMADDKLYASFMRHVFKRSKEDALESDFFNDEGGMEIEGITDLQEFTSAADRLLKLWDLTPATVNQPWVKPFADAAMRNYMMKRVTRPKIPYSGKVIAGPADPYLRSKMDIKPGHVYLDEAWKNKKIRWLNGEETTLGRAWDQFNKGSHGPSVKEEMERLLSFATIRVPADSISGTRILNFGGFTDRRGAGGTVHNEDMIYLGGMDLDIDSFFIFQDIDKSGGGRRTPIADHVNAHRYQFNQDQNPNKPIIDSKPPENDKDYVEVLKPFEQHDMATVDPRLLMNAQAGAYRGNKLIGTAAVTGRRGMSWWQEATSGNQDALTVAPTQAVKSILRSRLKIDDPNATVRIIPTDDTKAFEAVRREAMNRAVDAGDFAGFKKNKKTLGQFITKNLIKYVEVDYTDGNGRKQKRRMKPDDEMAQSFSPSKTKMWKRMAAVDTYAKGKNYGDQFSAKEAWDILGKKIGDIGEVPERFDQDILYSLDELPNLLAKDVAQAAGRNDINPAVVHRALKGSRSHPRSYTLSQTLKNLKRFRSTLDAPNTHYQALSYLADVPFANLDHDPRYLNKDGYRELVRTFNKVYAEETKEAAIARRMISRLELPIKESAGLTPWQVQGDIQDMVSVRMAYDAALSAIKGGADITNLNRIANKVEELKQRHEAAVTCG